jgi:hypothetical protein
MKSRALYRANIFRACDHPHGGGRENARLPDETRHRCVQPWEAGQQLSTELLSGMIRDISSASRRERMRFTSTRSEVFSNAPARITLHLSDAGAAERERAGT